MPATLSLRTLNRTYLHRQMLLDRADVDIAAAVEQLVGLQAQLPNPPYLGLWTRLRTFSRADLTARMEQRHIVRAPFWRSTLHVISAADFQRFRPLVEPALVKALSAFFGDRARGLDRDALLNTARAALSEAPLSMGELGRRLLDVEPDRDTSALDYFVRTYLPLVQIPPGGTWGSGSFARYALADDWLPNGTRPVGLEALFRRYLAAFGPASIMDFQTWTGLTRLNAVERELSADLVVYQDEAGKTLYDLPGAPLIDADAPAPVRFIPEYDNLLIGHANRARILPEVHRKRVLLSAGRVLNTILVDGFVAGTWRIESKKGAVTLRIAPFAELRAADRDALAAEGERLVRFVVDDVRTIALQIDAAANDESV